MKKTSKKILAVVLALAMVFAMSATALALDPGENPGLILGGNAIPPTDAPDCSTYLMTQPEATDSVTVTFIMEAPDEYWEEAGAFYYEEDITLTADIPQTYTISDLLVKVAENNPEFEFFTKGEKDASGNDVYPFTKDSVYLYGVTHNGITWQPEEFDLWGWEFRINNLFPVVERTAPNGYEGPDLNQTYISNGEVIHFFWDYPATLHSGDESFNYATNFIRLMPISIEPNSITVQIQGQKVGYETLFYEDDNGKTQQVLQLQVFNYENFKGETTVSLCDSNGTTIASGKTDINGQISFSTENITPGYYI